MPTFFEAIADAYMCKIQYLRQKLLNIEPAIKVKHERLLYIVMKEQEKANELLSKVCRYLADKE